MSELLPRDLRPRQKAVEYIPSHQLHDLHHHRLSIHLVITLAEAVEGGRVRLLDGLLLDGLLHRLLADLHLVVDVTVGDSAVRVDVNERKPRRERTNLQSANSVDPSLPSLLFIGV